MSSLQESDAPHGGYAIDRADIEAAAARLAGVAVRTPLLEAPLLNERLGFRLLVKAEVLQRTGSFKFRGAYNAIARLDEASRKAGIVAFSSGNHAQGVAAAAALQGAPATIVMPADAPRIKIENTRAWGATVVPYDRYTESREEIGAKIARDTGASLVRPYDDPGVIAGQATVGLEIAEQAEAMGFTPATVAAPCSGGGLTSGIAFALSVASPSTKVRAVEPAAFDDTRRSLECGERVEIEPGGRSICDALLSPSPGELTFPILSGLGVEGLAVTEESVRKAMAEAFRHFKIVVEPGGAAALAAVLDGQIGATGAPVVCVCSGGNADASLFADVLTQYGS